MSELYERIKSLCDSKGITGYRMCKDLKIPVSTMTDLKTGKTKGLSAAKAEKIANYFGVEVSELLGTRVTYTFDEEAMNQRWNETKNRSDRYDQELQVSAAEFSDLAETFNTLRDRPEMKTLFKSAKNATPEQIMAVAAMFDSFKKD